MALSWHNYATEAFAGLEDAEQDILNNHGLGRGSTWASSWPPEHFSILQDNIREIRDVVYTREQFDDHLMEGTLSTGEKRRLMGELDAAHKLHLAEINVAIGTLCRTVRRLEQLGWPSKTLDEIQRARHKRRVTAICRPDP